MSKKIIKKVVADLSYTMAKRNANSSCFFLLYQSKLPEKVKKLRKF